MAALLAVGSLALPVCGSCAEQNPGALGGFGGCRCDRMRVNPRAGDVTAWTLPRG